MKREILVNATPRETRVAILEDGQLVELLVDRPDARRRFPLVSRSASLVHVSAAETHQPPSVSVSSPDLALFSVHIYIQLDICYTTQRPEWLTRHPTHHTH